MVELLFEVVLDGSGMEACHGTEVLGVLTQQGVELRGAGAVDIRQQHGGDTGVEGTLHGGVAVGVEGFVVEVAVGVDVHRRSVLLYDVGQQVVELQQFGLAGQQAPLGCYGAVVVAYGRPGHLLPQVAVVPLA